MTDRRAEILKAALGRLERGGWSLTVNGFARKALRLPEPLSPSLAAELRMLMHGLGLRHRRVPYAGAMGDVWDYDAP